MMNVEFYQHRHNTALNVPHLGIKVGEPFWVAMFKDTQTIGYDFENGHGASKEIAKQNLLDNLEERLVRTRLLEKIQFVKELKVEA